MLKIFPRHFQRLEGIAAPDCRALVGLKIIRCLLYQQFRHDRHDHHAQSQPCLLHRIAVGSQLTAKFFLCSSVASFVVGVEPAPVTSTIVADVDHAWPADFRSEHGQLSVDSLLAEGRVFWRPHPAIRIGLGIGASRDDYASDGVDPLVQLPDHVQHVWLRLPVSVMGSMHWGLSLQGSVGIGTDGHEDGRPERQYQFQGGPVYVRDPDLIICLLLNVSSQIDRSPSIFPFPSVYWHFCDDFRLTVIDEVDNVSRLMWRMRDDIDVGLRLDVRFREAALAGNAVLSDDHVALACEGSWRPFCQDGLIITPFVGAVLARRLTLRVDGDERWSATTRPAPLIGLSIRTDF